MSADYRGETRVRAGETGLRLTERNRKLILSGSLHSLPVYPLKFLWFLKITFGILGPGFRGLDSLVIQSTVSE